MGSDWRRSRRAHWVIFWIVRALYRPSDRGNRGRIYWREKNRESWSRWVGHIFGWSGRHCRQTFYRADYDRDFSDERALAIVRRAHLTIARARLRRAAERAATIFFVCQL